MLDSHGNFTYITSHTLLYIHYFTYITSHTNITFHTLLYIHYFTYGRCENPECRNITEYGGISRNMPEYHDIFRW